MPHFFINSNQIENDKILICDKENFNHITRSLRARTGEKLLLIDENQIQYETTIENITKNEIVATVNNFYKSKRNLDFNLYLAQSPLRSDAQNLLIEKATELGIAGIYPIKTDNCALNREMIDRKNEKWNKIMYESSKQCERAIIPKCFEQTTIKNLIEEKKFDKIIVFCERIADKTIHQSFVEKPIKKGDNTLIVIGPEGGFSQKEFEYFNNNPSAEMLTLGDMILRAETATIVALGNVIYEYSNYQK